MVNPSSAEENRSDQRLQTVADIMFEASDRHRLLAETKDAMAVLLDRTPLTAVQAKHLTQAVMEMGGNAIEWGRNDNAEPWTQVAFRVGPEAVTVTISDRGPGFDHTGFSLQALAKQIDENSPSLRKWGFGIMLTRGLVDEFVYNEPGNQVTLVKRFAHGPGS